MGWHVVNSSLIFIFAENEHVIDIYCKSLIILAAESW